MIDLNGKVAAVTGAVAGTFAEVAHPLAKAGAPVLLGDVQAERGALPRPQRCQGTAFTSTGRVTK